MSGLLRLVDKVLDAIPAVIAGALVGLALGTFVGFIGGIDTASAINDSRAATKASREACMQGNANACRVFEVLSEG